MALTATIYNFSVQLADVDRGIYESFDLRLARHPSETSEYMLARLFAYCLQYSEGIAFSDSGVSSGEEPAVFIRDMTGRMTMWIEVGMPDADRLHRGMKLAGRAAVYTHREIRNVLGQLNGKKIHRAEEIAVVALDPAVIGEIGALLEKRNAIALTITEGQIYVDLAGKSIQMTPTTHRIE
jgi:uncharacterized protein YaeQ